MVLLSGEPGIGKTRLASYAAHDAHAEGFAVVWGACTEELAVPYEPWIGVCSQLVESAPAELLGRHVERHKGELARLARNLESRVSDLAEPQASDPETERYLLFNAVAGLLAEVAETVPLCVVLDDLHWADAQSLALLKHVLRTHEQGSLLLIATFRDSDLDGPSARRSACGSAPSARRAADRPARPRSGWGGRVHDGYGCARAR